MLVDWDLEVFGSVVLEDYDTILAGLNYRKGGASGGGAGGEGEHIYL